MSTTTSRPKSGAKAHVTAPIATQLECSLRATVDAVNLASSETASPAALRQELQQILSEGHDRAAMLTAAMALACRASGALLAAYFQRDEQGQLALLAEHRDARLDPALMPDRAALEQGAALACSRCAVQVARLQSRNSAVAVPLGTNRDPIGAVSLLLPTVEMPAARQANVEMLLAWLATWLGDESRRQAAWEARTAAAIIELSLAIAKAGNLRQACLVLASDAQAHLSCRQVAVGLRRGERMRVAAVSGLAEVQCDTELVGVLENCLDEVLVHDQAIVWPPAAQDVASAWPAHRQLAAATGARALASATLRAADGRIVGAWVLVADEPFVEPEHTARALAAAAAPIGASLDAVAHRRRITRAGLLRTAGLCGWRKLLAPAAAMGLVLAVPLPYRISCSFQLEPVTRRYVAAPFEGIFEKSLVKPGDMVARGQLLGRMDGREVRWELAGLEADASRAGKSRDSNLAASKVAAAQMDRLEKQRIDERRHLLASRAERLEIRSPLDGIVLEGDLQRSEGVPVTMGQSLYEIAPLEKLVAEVAIPDSEVALTDAGLDVRLHLDAYPGRSWDSTLERIQPRAELRETDNVFVAEAPLANDAHQLRPGMKGTATVYGPRRSLFWIAFHKPWNYLANWLSW
jgi:multidrug efflux pump subunit AcrA (membrane-fusion protein)